MTREKAAKILYNQWQGFLEDNIDYAGISDAYKMAIKALEQEDVLNQIKEEIRDNTYFINEITEKEGIDFETVEKIIDKYRAESEETTK